MHPVIRVFSVIVAIGFLAKPEWNTVLFVLVLSLGLLAFKGRALLHSSLKMLWRLKWLYLSILIVYGWFTPGAALVVLSGIKASYIPTQEGLQAGGLRVTVLIAIVIMVAGLLQTLEKDKLVSAIIWLATPLSVMRLDIRRFALLLVLTLDKVLLSETSMRKSLESNKQEKTGLLNTASMVLTNALANIESETGQDVVEIELLDISSPPLLQWLLPAMFTIALYLIS